MLLKIAYLLTCRILGLAVLVFRGDREKDAELVPLQNSAEFNPMGNLPRLRARSGLETCCKWPTRAAIFRWKSCFLVKCAARLQLRKLSTARPKRAGSCA